MAILFNEIEATVTPDAAPEGTSAEPGQAGREAQADPHALQHELARMLARTLRLKAD